MLIEKVHIDIIAGRQCESLMRLSAVRPRSPARVPCMNPAPWQSRAGCAVCMYQVSAAAVVAARTFILAAVELSSWQQLREGLLAVCSEGSGQGSGRYSEAQQAQSMARARGSGRTGQLGARTGTV